jgi:hypothetical protein
VRYSPRSAYEAAASPRMYPMDGSHQPSRSARVDTLQGSDDHHEGPDARHTGANVQLVIRDAVAPEDPVISVHADNVDASYEEARSLATRSCTR